MRDLPSAALAWIAAALGVGLAAVAARYPHESPKTPAAWLAVSAVVTVQLLAFAVTCYTSRFWLANPVSAAPASPNQPLPKTRRGIPALKGNQSAACGLDAWSIIAVLLVLLPVAVPLVSLYRPSAYLRASAPTQALPSGLTHNRQGVAYTTSSYEAGDLAFHKQTDARTREIVLRDSADVHIMKDSNMVAVPSRVDDACLHDKVRASNLKAVYGLYKCQSGPQPPEVKRPLNTSSTTDRVDLEIWEPEKRPNDIAQWKMTIKLDDDKENINCEVTYQLIYPVTVTWVGKNTSYARICHIDSMTYGSDAKILTYDNSTKASFTGLWEANKMQDLSLAFKNAFVHAADLRGSESKNYFIGSIFAATTIIRATSLRINPGREFTDDDLQDWPKEERYATVTTYSTRFNYGWSGVVLVLIVADVLLAVAATALSSRQTSQQLAGMKSEAFGGLFSKRRNATSTTTSGAPDGAASSMTAPSKAPSSFNHYAGVPQYSQHQLPGGGAPDPLGRAAEPYAADVRSSQAGSYSQPQQQGPGHGPGAPAHYP